MTNCNGFCAYVAYKMAIIFTVRILLIPIEWYENRYPNYNKYNNNTNVPLKETFVDRCHRERITHQKEQNEKIRQMKAKQKQSTLNIESNSSDRQQ